MQQRRTDDRGNREDSPHEPEHDKNKDTRNALDHVQLLDRRAGRPLHPPPRWSYGSPPPTRPTGRGAADGPFVRTHSRAARRSGLAVRIRAPWGGRRRDRRRGRARRGVAGGVRHHAHRRARPRPGRSGGSTAAVVRLRGPRHAHRRPVLHAGIGSLPSRVRASGGRAPRPGRQLPAARLVRAGVLLPGGRTARHADGPDHRPHRRRPRQHPSGRGSGSAVPGERRGSLVRAHRPSRRQSPATDLDEAAGRSRGVGGAGAGPPEGYTPPAGSSRPCAFR